VTRAPKVLLNEETLPSTGSPAVRCVMLLCQVAQQAALDAHRVGSSAVIGMVWSGLVWRSNQTRPAPLVWSGRSNRLDQQDRQDRQETSLGLAWTSIRAAALRRTPRRVPDGRVSRRRVPYGDASYPLHGQHLVQPWPNLPSRATTPKV
jgi:hypothetical protein